MAACGQRWGACRPRACAVRCGACRPRARVRDGSVRAGAELPHDLRQRVLVGGERAVLGDGPVGSDRVVVDEVALRETLRRKREVDPQTKELRLHLCGSGVGAACVWGRSCG
jgi:hypothetical protein